MPHGGGAPSADRDTPALTAPARPGNPSLTPEADSQQARVVVDSVNDNVDRVSRIIQQREQAKQAASDVRELREARQASDTKALKSADAVAAGDVKSGEKIPDEASTIERLAAALRAHEPIDAVPATPAASTSNQALSASNAALDPNVTVDEKNASSAAFAAGTMGTPTQLELGRLPGKPSPSVSRQSSVNPMLELEQNFESRVAADPRDLSSQMELQLLRFLKDEPVPAMSDLSALPVEDREILAAMCDALSNFRSIVKSEANPLGSEKARPFIEMADRIRARADLTLSGLSLCEKVNAFGNFKPMDLDKFTVGSPKRCVLYCEVDGFLSQLDAAQQWETKLSLELKLYDDRGLQVWTLPPEVVVDSSRRRRRDFFIAKMIELPSNLGGGHYLLKASVKDVQANRVAESTIQFTVAAKDPVP